MIKYDYEITVNGNTAKLNKDIYLFRGNKNVHYYFAVKNASFNFKGSTDLIEKTNAINAAVTVIKPNNVEVASAIAKVENGKIHLKVTEDLIDEEVEVGDFDLVFDLFDDVDGAVTIPKVAGQFHVLERPCTTPISELAVATNTTNEVDYALTDYAITTYAEPVASTNEDGTFAKKTWVPKEKITTAELNRMEEGISNVSSQCKEIANLFSTEQTNSSFIIKYGNKIIAEIPLNSSGETEEPQNIVTDGLIINFDATNKKGEDSTTISNLVDNTSFPISADSTTYNQNNGITITESPTSGITIPIKDDNYGITDEITIEIGIIGAVDGYWSRGQAKCEVDTNSSYKTFLRVPYFHSSGSASIGAVAVSSNIINKSNTKIDEYRKKFHSITVRINASGDACLFVNGEKLQLPNNSTIFNIPGYKDLSNFLTETNNNFYFMKSTTSNNTTAVFCYGRIYKRALSDSEILNNYKVDSNKISKLGE